MLSFAGSVRALQAFSGLDPGLVRVLLVLTSLLAGATVLRGVLLLRNPERKTHRGWRSLGTWWILHLLLVAILVLGRPAVALVMVAVSLLGLREALHLLSSHELLPLLTLPTLLLYLWGWLDWTSLFTVALPALVVFLAGIEVVRRIFWPRALSRIRWILLSFLLAVVGPSFVLGVASLPVPDGLPGSTMGWLLALLVLTELNDMAQAWWGRTLGSRSLVPAISPRKTWEGFWGGVGTTVVAAFVLTPVVTPYGRVPLPFSSAPESPWLWVGLLGLMVALAGVAGDLSASLLKRRAGVKDAGDLLPAQGGVLDRFDSLALSAPVFFLFTWVLWVRPW
jgi:phosphatidate cytidylyltransferase